MKAALLNDRLNIIFDQIGYAGILSLIQNIKDAGCTHIGLNQHDNGGFWEPKFISLMRDAIEDALMRGLKVIYFSDDISKAARGNPAGWNIRLGKHTPQLVSRTIASNNTNRVFIEVNLKDAHLYQLHYKAVDSDGNPVVVEPFLHLNDWQLSKYGRAAEARVEFIPIGGDARYLLSFRSDRLFTLKIVSLRAVDKPASALGTVSWDEDDEICGIYHGTEGPSGHFHCQTPNLNDTIVRRAVLAASYSRMMRYYGNYVMDGTIDSVFIGGDEFTACGGSYGLEDLMAEIDRHSTAACALGLRCLLWARPADYANPSRGNYPGSLKNAGSHLFIRSIRDEITPILWQEQTTEALCKADRLAYPGIAGVYLGLSNPQHFSAAGHTSFAAHWWPRDGKTWADYPIDELRTCCEVIA